MCCGCSKEKPLTSFYKSKMVKSGYDNKCKICKQQGKLCRTGRKRVYNASLKRGPMLISVSTEDWIEAYRFLQRIGYDLSLNIHEQFCQKHNLNTRKRGYEKSKQYSPKDLGLI